MPTEAVSRLAPAFLLYALSQHAALTGLQSQLFIFAILYDVHIVVAPESSARFTMWIVRGSTSMRAKL